MADRRETSCKTIARLRECQREATVGSVFLPGQLIGMARDRKPELPSRPHSAGQHPDGSEGPLTAGTFTGGHLAGRRRGRSVASDGRASESIRGVATFVLSFYLVGLALTVAGNSASGTSALVGLLKDRLFSPLLVPPWLDLGHDTRLTYGLPEDADHHIEVSPAVNGAGRPLRIPAARERSERAGRWRRLARAAAISEESDAQAGVLPAAIGAGLFATAGSDDLIVHVDRVVPPEFSAAASPSVAETALEARVRRVAGDVQMIPLKAPEEMAPVVDAAPVPGAGRGGP